MRRYPINEMFLTIQGEATFTGTPAVFIRLQGCNVGCSFCDTKHTWRIDPAATVEPHRMLAKLQDAPTFAEMTPEEVGTLAQKMALGARHVVLTGGEPADHDLAPLEDALRRRGFRVQIETSGTARLTTTTAFVTVSPKIAMPGGLAVRRDVVMMADEIKHPCAIEKHLQQLLALLGEGWHRPGIPIWLQPLSVSPQATERCVDWCKTHGFRLSLQTHKYLGLR